MAYLQRYLFKIPPERRDTGAMAFYAAIDHVARTAPSVAAAILAELRAQSSHLKLIASENYSSLAVQLAMGNLLTDKYAEGFPRHRFYAGCENVDTVEIEADEELKLLFGAEHAYSQPHSGSDANLVAFWAILVSRVQDKAIEELGKKSIDELGEKEWEEVRTSLLKQRLLGMSLQSGGHLTHGYRHNVSGKFFQSFSYDVDPSTGLLDYDQLATRVQEVKPLVLLAGYSAYSRRLNFARMREIADSVGAVLLVDMAHFAGLVAGKVFEGEFDPVPYAHIVTSTTHKTLRGPRGGFILCTKEFKEAVDKGCPLVLGGPLPNVIAAKVVAFKEANTPEFRSYSKQIVINAHILAEELMKKGVPVLTGGTENHLVLVDVRHFGLNGRQAENALNAAGLTVNRNAIFNDPNGVWYTSGIRLGTAALTTLGMKAEEMREVADTLYHLLSKTSSQGSESRVRANTDGAALETVKKRVKELLQAFPLYPELDIEGNRSGSGATTHV